MGAPHTSLFTRFSNYAAHASGRPLAFLMAALIVVAWLASGPFFGYSDTWQLVISTGTTIITFLMVFLIQSTQNRDSQAVQIKLDELIRAVRPAKNELLDLEELDQTALDELRAEYERLAEVARQRGHRAKRHSSRGKA
jgi:low affinity Fe/Cu permease